MNTTRWQNRLNAMLGVWLIVSPLLLGFHDYLIPMRNSVFVGIAILIVSTQAIEMPETWEVLGSLLFGVWLLVSPLILGFHGPMVARYNSVIVGSAVAILSLWATYRGQGFQHWWRAHCRHP